MTVYGGYTDYTSILCGDVLKSWKCEIPIYSCEWIFYREVSEKEFNSGGLLIMLEVLPIRSGIIVTALENKNCKADSNVYSQKL